MTTIKKVVNPLNKINKNNYLISCAVQVTMLSYVQQSQQRSKMKKIENRLFEEIVNFFGSRSLMADTLGLNRSHISLWLRRGAIPSARAIQIETLSGGLFTARSILGVDGVDDANL
jgi:hypothetical protein